eukprot:TRINITY_DN4307_c0_g1_i1.p1 TRINITY_DN4307_c0_g1~~TRINITY_DN4307_c0_g1_i1.p1  ORF type:complete len:616 (+),score=100.85 TRINITY_DN4307_c0_g1_i1:159-2006(+)
MSSSKTETPLLMSEVSGSGSFDGQNMNLNNMMKGGPLRQRVTSFGDVKMVAIDSGSDDGGVHVRRRLSMISHSVLRESDIDIQRLRDAFSSLDVQGDGGLELSEFRNMWKIVFPQRSLDQDAWKATEKMFSEMDVDGSGIITFEEIIHYLEVHRRRELERCRTPKSTREWIWQYVGNSNVPRAWMQDAPVHVQVSIFFWRVLSQVLMALGIVVVFIDSLPRFQNQSGYPGTDTTFTLDVIVNVFFTIDFILWVVSYPAQPPPDPQFHARTLDTDSDSTPPPSPRTAPVFSPSILFRGAFWMEAVALVAFYRRALDFDHSVPTRSLSVFRLFRVMRVLRAIRSWTKSHVRRSPELGRALRKSFMSLLFLVMLMMIVLIVTSSVMYFAEQHEASFDHASLKWIRWNNSQYEDSGQPTPYQSIPDAFWWSIVTITTVGYGDQVPRTIPGKVVASLTMLAGLVVVSFPITILTSTFQAMEADRVDRETRILECEAFYNGIKKWLETGGVVKKATLVTPTSRGYTRRESVNPIAMSPFGAPKVTFNSSITSDTQLDHSQVVSVIEACISKSLSSLEDKLVKSLSSLEDRVASLEAEVKRQNDRPPASLEGICNDVTRFQL